MKSRNDTIPSTSCANVTNGIWNDSIVNAPPRSPTRLANSVSSGVISNAARTRVVTRKRTGSSPIVVSASISWLTRIVPISAANAAPERPASRIAVISAPSSRSIDRPIRSATKISAPNFFIGTADWNARITPIRNEISATIGNASAPHLLADEPDVAPADRRRMPHGVGERGHRLAHERDLLAHVAQHAGGDEPHLLDRRAPLRLGIEIVHELRRVELAEQRVHGGPQVGDLHRRGMRLAQEVDEERDARPVAVLDAGAVDEHGPCAGIIQRAHRFGPYLRDGVGVEAAGQREHAPAVGAIGNCQGRGSHGAAASGARVKPARRCCRRCARDRPAAPAGARTSCSPRAWRRRPS